MKCNTCGAKLPIFGQKRKCQECNKFFCEGCFKDDENNYEKLLYRGWCWNCYIKNEETPYNHKRSESEVNYI